MRLEGVLNQCNKLSLLIFQSAKVDMLRIIKPASLILQSTSILLPDAVSIIKITVKKIWKLRKIFQIEGEEPLKNEKFFPTLNKEILPLIEYDEEGLSLGRSTCREPAHSGVVTFEGHTLSEKSLEDTLTKVSGEMSSVLIQLEQALDECLSFIAEDPLFVAVSMLLDSKSFQFKEEKDIVEAAEKVYEHFKIPLEANHFNKHRICKIIYYFV